MSSTTTLSGQLDLKCARGASRPADLDCHRTATEARPEWGQFTENFAFLVPGASLPHLAAGTKEEAIGLLIDSLVGAGAIAAADRDELHEAVLRREELGTTGIGEGVAVPHTKHTSVTEVVGAVGYIPAGIDFDSVDGRPVHLVFLLISPPGASREHLLALESISRRLIDPAWESWHAPRS
jgi:PTS system fructose-specific IIA component/PTS system nitrogen regulatory IIA component